MPTIREEPLDDVTVWKAADILPREDWRYVLSAVEIDDIHAADTELVYVRNQGIVLNEPSVVAIEKINRLKKL